MNDPILNLSAWIERRSKAVGPYAEHIIHSVTAYETHITAQAAEIERLRNVLEAITMRTATGDGLSPDETIEIHLMADQRPALSKEGG